MMMSLGITFAIIDSMESYAQMDQTLQSINNQTQTAETTPAPATPSPAANETAQLTSQTSSQPQMDATELLNLTNAAIIALNEDEPEQAQQILSEIQQQLISNLGKEVVVIPSEAFVSIDDEEDE